MSDNRAVDFESHSILTARKGTRNTKVFSDSRNPSEVTRVSADAGENTREWERHFTIES